MRIIDGIAPRTSNTTPRTLRFDVALIPELTFVFCWINCSLRDSQFREAVCSSSAASRAARCQSIPGSANAGLRLRRLFSNRYPWSFSRLKAENWKSSAAAQFINALVWPLSSDPWPCDSKVCTLNIGPLAVLRWFDLNIFQFAAHLLSTLF